MDIVLKGNVDGVRAAEHIRGRFGIPVIYLSSLKDEATLQRAKITEPYGYILKPFRKRELHTNIEIALYKHLMESKLKKSEEALRASLEKAEAETARTEAIIAAIGDGLSIQNTEHKILYQNEIHKGFVGDHIGEYCYKAYEMKDDICEGCPLAMSFEDGKTHTVERTNPTGTLQVEITASPVRDAAGNIVAGIEIARDVTKRKHAEEALRESEERYRILFENAHDMIQSVAPDGRFIFVNSAWLNTLGYTQDDLSTLTLFDILHPDCKSHCGEIFRKVMSGEPMDSIEAVFIAKDGRSIDVEGNVSVRCVGGKVIATQGIFRDVTERKKAELEKARLEAQLLHVQKMEAIGTLTGGIAHEFNNILTVIMGYGDFLHQGMDRDNPLRPYVDVIQASAIRATHLTQSLLAYSRKQVMNSRPVDLSETARNVGRLLSRLIGENVELRSIPAGEELIVMADPGQIEQVLMNLATNARDAMPEGGLLTIEIESAFLDNTFVKTHGYGKPGLYAVISVRDTGIGMDDAVRKRIFEPFFTTKESGKGTGLGLAMAYGIIKQHEGYIEVQSEPLKGTTFKIYLPLIRSEAEEPRPADITSFEKGTETVLVAEDDAVVRQLTRDVLERSGYKVIEAVDGEDAIGRFLEHKDAIRLLVFDVMMPKKNGKDAYKEIRKIHPDMKAIFMSGYPTDLVHEDGLHNGRQNFIAKPVSPVKFSKMVRDMLDG
jgi:PAS domain S-box-containing protein